MAVSLGALKITFGTGAPKHPKLFHRFRQQITIFTIHPLVPLNMPTVIYVTKIVYVALRRARP